MVQRDASGKPVSYGICCVCEKKCFSGQDLVAGEDGCPIRHKNCVTQDRLKEMFKEERWG